MGRMAGADELVVGKTDFQLTETWLPKAIQTEPRSVEVSGGPDFRRGRAGYRILMGEYRQRNEAGIWSFLK